MPLKAPSAYDAAGAAVARTSLDNWLSMPEHLTGFSRPVAAMMNVQLGRRTAAISNISFFFEKSTVTCNTMYSEGAPCGESPPAAAASIQDLMLSSAADGTLLVFGGVDDAVVAADPSFYRLRADHALLVSGRRNTSARAAAWVHAENGGRGRRKWTFATDMRPPLRATPATAAMGDLGGGRFTITLAPGEAAAVSPAAAGAPELLLAPAALNQSTINSWGKREAPPCGESGWPLRPGELGTTDIAGCDGKALSADAGYCIVQAGASAFSLCEALGDACSLVAVPLDADWMRRFPGSVQLMGGAPRASTGWNACAKPGPPRPSGGPLTRSS